jgi:hypothetical protein
MNVNRANQRQTGLPHTHTRAQKERNIFAGIKVEGKTNEKP